jgi:hypothetical protein
MYSIITAYS